MRYETRCERCDESELRAVTQFAKKVFDVDFPNYLPYIYGEHATTGRYHFVVRENGEYAAAVLSFPNDLHVKDRVLGTVGVGTVCVREESRGRGYMTDLLAECLMDARDRGASLLILGGQRQRYEYYGFASSGVYSSYKVSYSSKTHCLGDRPSKYTAEIAKPEDGAVLVEIMKDRTVYADRYAESFVDNAQHDWNKVYLFREGNEVVGYCVSNDEMSWIGELAFRRGIDPAEAVDEVILCAFARGRDSLNVEVPAHEFRLAERMSAVCGGWDKGAYASLCFIDFPAAINAFGRLRDLGKDADGDKFVLEIEEHPFLKKIGVSVRGKDHGRFRFSVKDGFVQAEPTEDPADLTLPYLRAVEVLFSDLGVLAYDLPAKVRCVLPIPFFFPHPDEV